MTNNFNSKRIKFFQQKPCYQKLAQSPTSQILRPTSARGFPKSEQNV